MTSWNEFLYGKDWATRTDIPYGTDGVTTYPNPNYKPETDKYSLGHLDPRKGKNMNDNLNTQATVANADMAGVDKLLDSKLTDKQLEELLAHADGGPIAYITDADETTDEPTPTLH